MTIPNQPLPYASPTPLAIEGDLFHHATLLIARDNITLPARCILCNQPATPIQNKNPLTLNFSWDASFKRESRPSTLELRRKGAIHAYLCPRHLRAYRTGRLIGIFGMLLSLLLMAVSALLAAVTESSVVPRYTSHAMAGLLAGFALFILFLFLFTFKTRTLSCTKIDQGYLHLTGLHPDLLKTFPPLPNQNP